MKLEFTKMQALGNDYILIDGFRYPQVLTDAPRLAVPLSDRHFGIGADGLIFAAPSASGDLMMRMFNADGSESEMCGNGIRQLALFAHLKGITRKTELKIETLGGMKLISMTMNAGGTSDSIRVDMGEPILEVSKIPAVAEKNTQGFSQVALQVEDRPFTFTLVSMGNPHAVTFVGNTKELNVEKYGRPVENNTAVFPRRTNVEFIEILSRTEVNMRVWERGSGETLACGTGACASVVAGILNGLLDTSVTVHLLGGDLQITWNDTDNRVIMTGNAKAVYDGIVEI